MTADLSAKCCVKCGRWGNRDFYPASNMRDGWECANDRACAERVRRDEAEDVEAALSMWIRSEATDG